VFLNFQDTISDLVAGDFSRDGKTDAAVLLWNTHTVSILSGQADGTLQPGLSYRVGPNPAVAAVADFNADGWLDLAVASADSDLVSILEGNGDGTFNLQQVTFGIGSLPSVTSLPSMTVVDFNGDGKPDLATVNYTLNGVTVLTNTTP
jgi:hypothetical protein